MTRESWVVSIVKPSDVISKHTTYNNQWEVKSKGVLSMEAIAVQHRYLCFVSNIWQVCMYVGAVKRMCIRSIICVDNWVVNNEAEGFW